MPFPLLGMFYAAPCPAAATALGFAMPLGTRLGLFWPPGLRRCSRGGGLCAGVAVDVVHVVIAANEASLPDSGCAAAGAGRPKMPPRSWSSSDRTYSVKVSVSA